MVWEKLFKKKPKEAAPSEAPSKAGFIEGAIALCPTCGTQLPLQASFCYLCGTKVTPKLYGGMFGGGTAAQATLGQAQALTTIPSADNTYNLGSTSYRWANFYGGSIYPGLQSTRYITDDGTYTKTSAGLSINSNILLNSAGYADFPNIATPAAPGSGTARIYGFSTQSATRPWFIDSNGIGLAITRDTAFIVRNTTGSPIAANKVVYATTTSTDSIPDIALARANATGTMPAIGITLQSIANNAYGYVLYNGILTMDTSAWSAGDRIWLSTSSAGGLQNTRPTWPNYVQRMGVVLNSGVGNGALLVETGPAITSGQSVWESTTTSFQAGASGSSGTISWGGNTGDRTYTFPDNTGTMAMLNLAQTWSGGEQVFSSGLSTSNLDLYGSVGVSTINAMFVPNYTTGDAIAFKTPYKVEYFSGGIWNDITGSATWGYIVDHKSNDRVTLNTWVSGGNLQIRFYFNLTGQWSYNTMFLNTVVQHFGTITNILVEEATDSAISASVNTLLSVGSLSISGDTNNTIKLTTAGFEQYCRITYTITGSASDCSLIEISLLEAGDWSGAGGSQTIFPIGWDVARNITIYGNVVPSSDNTYAIGTSSARWGSIGAMQYNVWHTASDANPTSLLGDAYLKFGAGGGSALDINISRTGSAVLTMSAGVFTFGTNISFMGAQVSGVTTSGGLFWYNGSNWVDSAYLLTDAYGDIGFNNASTQAHIGALAGGYAIGRDEYNELYTAVQFSVAGEIALNTSGQIFKRGNTTTSLSPTDIEVVPIKAGVPADGDYTAPFNGLVAFDSSNNRFYVRTGGAWVITAAAQQTEVSSSATWAAGTAETTLFDETAVGVLGGWILLPTGAITWTLRDYIPDNAGTAWHTLTVTGSGGSTTLVKIGAHTIGSLNGVAQSRKVTAQPGTGGAYTVYYEYRKTTPS